MCDLQHRLQFLLDTVYGLRAIHNVGMIHGDLKTLNLLVTLEGRVKVADFGLSKLLGISSIVPGTKTISGTPQYMAPEVMHCKPQGLRVDTYSMGIVMWEMMAGAVPWRQMDYVQIIQRVTHSDNETQRPPPGRPPIESMHRALAPSGYIQLMEDCWAQQPKWRPSADQCVFSLEEIKRRVVDPNGLANPSLIGGKVSGQDAHLHHGDRSITDSGYGQKSKSEPAMKRPRVHDMPGAAGWNRPEQAERAGPEFRNAMDPPKMFMESGGLAVLMNMLTSGNLDKVLQALSAMFEMCINNPQTQQALFDSKTLDVVLPLLEYWDRPDIQLKAANVIAVASSQNPHNRRTVVNAGAIAALVRLLSGTPQQQESAAQAIANTVKRPTGEEQKLLLDWDHVTKTKSIIVDAQEELNRFGGVEKLVQLMDRGSSRVKIAAAAAVANAMTECVENRIAFQEANGIAQVVKMLREGDCNAQVLWVCVRVVRVVRVLHILVSALLLKQ